MADNITLTTASGAAKIIQTTDNTNVHVIAHQVVNSDGTLPLMIKAEDTAHTTADTGIMVFAVRKDTAAALAGTDGDYIPLIVDSTGHLYTNTSISAIVPGVAATSLGKAEDAAHTSGDVGVMMLAKRTDTTPAATSGTDGDYEPLQVFAGRLWVTAKIDTALPAGTAAIGKLAANSGVDIGDVDVTSVTPGTTATDLGKAEDAAHTTGDTGVFILAVRSDAAASTGGTDGDYVALTTDATGRIWAHVSALEPGTAATSLGKAEDAAHSSGDVGVMALGVRNDTHTTALAGTDADYTPLGVDSTGKIGIRGTFAEDAGHTSGDLGIQVLSVRSDVAAATAGTTADYQPLITDAQGRLYTRPEITTTNGVSGAAFTSADASAAPVAVTDAPSAGTKLVIKEMTVSSAAALTFTFTEETAGTVFEKIYLAAGGTVHISYTGKQKLATAVKKLMVQTSGAGAVGVRVSYYEEA